MKTFSFTSFLHQCQSLNSPEEACASSIVFPPFFSAFGSLYLRISACSLLSSWCFIVLHVLNIFKAPSLYRLRAFHIPNQSACFPLSTLIVLFVFLSNNLNTVLCRYYIHSVAQFFTVYTNSVSFFWQISGSRAQKTGT